jgi:uncharacterized CHY-type Zn-finger protein/phage FluMu protein Com
MIPLNNQNAGSSASSRKQAVTQTSPTRVVAKPVPQSQARDPRSYQIDQLRRRFSPKESAQSSGATALTFKLKPSDPDFPFELDFLECEVVVPEDYPEDLPQLRVKNRNIPRGFGINIERGWDKLVEEKRGATLLALVNALDRNLESFLSEQKVETVKIVAFKDTRHLEQTPISGPSPTPRSAPATVPAPAPSPVRPYIPEESYSKDQIAEAKARRATETRQLESRMSRLTLYRRSADGIVYTLPIEPKRRFELPAGLQSVKTLHLIVPLLYPLQPLRIQLNEVESNDAEGVEELFVQKAIEQKQMTLMSHMNYLAQSFHVLAKQVQEAENQKAAAALQAAAAEKEEAGTALETEKPAEGDKRHIKIIPRPPEWTMVSYEDAEESSDDFSYESGESDEGGGTELKDADSGPSATLDSPERGTSMSFPSIELHSIELFQVAILSLSVKCARCKTVNDVTGLKHDVEKTESCRKCAAGFSVRFRQQLVHQNSTRAGFIDVSGCTIADMLPSTFVPVCAKCSTASPGLVSVRGETTTNVCRECHGKFTFKIPEVKFLVISAGNLPPPTAGPRRKVEKLGLHAGEPLPGRGACAHYKKSYRWFRFSCCSHVHPCDRCHDEAENHINEWANRMICGWCSREQNYAVEACQFCGRSVIGRKGRGFWEGGKGTRDRIMMNRKDRRKHKRVGGSESSSKKQQ